jgi:hypothetical protein
MVAQSGKMDGFDCSSGASNYICFVATGESAMIWTVMLWLAMQGHKPVEMHNLCLYNNSGDWRPCGPIHATTKPTPPHCLYIDGREVLKCPPNTEHVFEVRTKRTKITSNNTFDPAFLVCNSDRLTVKFDKQGDRDHEFLFSCTHVTRELWMDGKRLGIIKGLD